MRNYRKSFFAVFIGLILIVGFEPVLSIADDSTATQAQLQQQLLQIQDQIQQFQSQLNDIKAQKNTLQNKINQLKKQQALLQLQIQATNLQISQLGDQIIVTQNSIDANNKQVADLQEQVAGTLRLIHQNDATPFVFTVVAKQQLSDVFDAYRAYAEISQNLSSIINQLNQTDQQLADEKTSLTQQQFDAQNLLSIKVLQQSQLADSVSQQNTLLQQTKGREADYQIVISDTQAQAAAIRNRLYQLLGVSTQITFGQAVEVAKWAQGITGIQPAMLLAVLTQESNLGQNVGTCNRPGDPASKSYKVVMNPTRDIPPFLQITSDLGMNPEITPVSCPMKDKNGSQVGWGGAMGPAQFIPSTWMGYKDKVAQLTGKPAANPWDIRDAFLAAALKLTANGADGTDQGDWNAAMRYFSGSINAKYRFYGDNVIALKAKYQTDISSLSK